jgi:hypothetical protein
MFAHQSAYVVFFAMFRLRSGEPSSHHTGPLSPSAA